MCQEKSLEYRIKIWFSCYRWLSWLQPIPVPIASGTLALSPSGRSPTVPLAMILRPLCLLRSLPLQLMGLWGQLGCVSSVLRTALLVSMLSSLRPCPCLFHRSTALNALKATSIAISTAVVWPAPLTASNVSVCLILVLQPAAMSVLRDTLLPMA